MTLAPGTRLGPYEVTALIGVGGMGEVYRATDTKLKRNVAVKVLPPVLAGDPDRLARFQREAEVLASLSHPNIGGIHGLEESGGVTALVLELVEGPTLADRIAQGPIPIDEALPIVKQIAEALEAAHEQGIIHRDLKPANIKVREDGVVKVLDFGLAKLTQPAGSGPRRPGDLNQSPTITSPALMTGLGVILGTAAYMAPEQAKGRDADTRSDVWAFGCVLYEMLTGRRAFDGEDMTDVLGAVVRLEPTWVALPADVPLAVRTLIQRCLVKDRRHRLSEIATATFVLGELGTLGAAHPADEPSAAARRPGWRRVAALAVGALAAAAIGSAASWFVWRPSTPRVSRLTITPTNPRALRASGDRNLAISRDGTRLVYPSGDGSLLVRPLDQLDPTPLRGLGGPLNPFLSPDGQWIGFADGQSVLKKVAITGGAGIFLGPIDGTLRGASWGRDDTIVFATMSPTTGLQQMSTAGGEPTVLTRPNRAANEADHLWPRHLPDGESVLFTITAVSGGPDASSIAVLNRRTGKQTVLIRGGSDAQYLSSGQLVYHAGGTLHAAQFDLANLALIGASVPVGPEVITSASGSALVAVADDGTLVYVAGEPERLAARTLVWVDRRGKEEALKTAPPSRQYTYPRLAPNGTDIAVFLRVGEDQASIWLVNPARPNLTQVLSEPSEDSYPVWARDSKRLFFSSTRGGQRNIFTQATDGDGGVDRLTQSINVQFPTSLSPDGTRLVFTQTTTGTNQDVMVLSLSESLKGQAGTPTREIRPLVQTAAAERNGEVSPDGHWFAYESNESGRFEIYVRSFPEARERTLISASGGTRPVWASNGQELFYLAPTGALMRVGIEEGPRWAATTPTQLFEGPYFAGQGVGNVGRTYDVSPDGRRFLMIKVDAPPTDGGQGVPLHFVVVQNWTEELKRLVPVR